MDSNPIRHLLLISKSAHYRANLRKQFLLTKNRSYIFSEASTMASALERVLSPHRSLDFILVDLDDLFIDISILVDEANVGMIRRIGAIVILKCCSQLDGKAKLKGVIFLEKQKISVPHLHDIIERWEHLVV